MALNSTNLQILYISFWFISQLLFKIYLNYTTDLIPLYLIKTFGVETNAPTNIQKFSKQQDEKKSD